MNKIEKLKILLSQAETQSYRFYKKDNIAAGIRCRRLLQEGRILAQEIRMDVLEKKKEISNHRSKKEDERG